MSTTAVSGSDPSCLTGATCTVSSGQDGATSRTSSAFAREVAAEGRENAFGWSGHRLSVRVPSSATSVTATFVWRVESAAASASSTAGQVFGYAGLFAYAPWCRGTCTSTDDSEAVIQSSSADGSPGLTSGSGDPRDVTLVVRAQGELPKWLSLMTYGYSGAGGERSELCLPSAPCQVLSEGHAGAASSSIRATLKSSSVTFG